MNYIVFDLEWNQSMYGRSGEHPRMPFEIIEIGAVKVDENYKIIDEFQCLIKPRIYKRLHKNVKAVLNYDEKDLEKGQQFKQACQEFIKWCGKDYAFVTWGTSDVYYLQMNMDFYYMDKLPYPVKYYNLQQMYADKYDDGNICKLEKAVTTLKIEEEDAYHYAISDARYTAKVMAEMKPKNIKESYTYDIYRHPRKKDDEILDYHDGVLDHITSEYASKREALEDRELTTIRCSKCQKKCSRKVKWFLTASNNYLAIGRCWYHGYMLGKIKFKQVGGSDDTIFAVKRIQPTDKKGYEDVRDRQESIREKRKEKRHS